MTISNFYGHKSQDATSSISIYIFIKHQNQRESTIYTVYNMLQLRLPKKTMYPNLGSIGLFLKKPHQTHQPIRCRINSTRTSDWNRTGRCHALVAVGEFLVLWIVPAMGFFTVKKHNTCGGLCVIDSWRGEKGWNLSIVHTISINSRAYWNHIF